METEGQTTAETVSAAPPPSPMGEATPAPPLFLFLLWVPVFAAIAWGMMLLFGRRPWEFTNPQPLIPEPETDEPE